MPLSKKKILLVDDSLTARRLVLNFLAHLPLEILEAGDGELGLKLVEENKDIRLIFTDINMPKMNGLQMITEIKRKQSWAADIPICMLTTETGNDALNQAKSIGVNAFLVKPIQKDQLLAVVNGYLA